MAMHDRKLFDKLNQWKGEDASRASEVGEQRADIKDFLELTGWHKTALSWARKLDKLDSDKRDDILRSFDDLRRALAEKWGTDTTPDMFDAAYDAPVAEVPDGEAAENVTPMRKRKADPLPDDLQRESDDFDAHLAQVQEAAE